MPASATTSVRLAGNLSADGVLGTPQTNVLRSNITLMTTDGNIANGDTTFGDLAAGTFVDGKITVTGFAHDGTALAATDIAITGATTISSFLTSLNTALGATNAVATLNNGKIVITDVDSGYSQSDVELAFSNDGTANVEMPAYFELVTVGGKEVKNVNITVYDSQGGAHALSASLVRTDTENTWDMVLTSLTGNISELTLDNRRISGIAFDPTSGAFLGLSGSDTQQFPVKFAHDPDNAQTIAIEMGTVGRLDGLTQFAGNSTAVAREQDGYSAGRLSSVSVNNEGILIGAFSNGIKKNIAAVQIALFQNPAGLEALGNGYFTTSANSGEPVATQAMNGGAGSVHGGSLEKSNADVASEFVTLIQAQNGYQANARTIKVANDILNELTNLIR